MLQGVHFLLTYRCLFECDHCFLYCGPRQEGAFTRDQLAAVIDQGVAAGITEVYFEGGEPFLYYPIMIEGLKLARARGLDCGVVTNAYWATSESDAELWLRPLAEIGISDLSISDDVYHGDGTDDRPARFAIAAAQRLGLPVRTICIDKPAAKTSPAGATSEMGAASRAGATDAVAASVAASIPQAAGGAAATAAGPSEAREAGSPVVGGEVLFKGRAVETVDERMTFRPYICFDACNDEDLAEPSRVHVDPFGNVFVCQGLSIGNVWQRPLVEIMREYVPQKHPIVGPLLDGGPAALARRYGLPDGPDYVSGCHLCFLVRKNFLDRFPEYLCPAGVYGEDTRR